MSSNPAVVSGAVELAERPMLRVFSTCPSSLITPDNYLQRAIQVAQWSERAGCTGILIYTDN